MKSHIETIGFRVFLLIVTLAACAATAEDRWQTANAFRGKTTIVVTFRPARR